MNIKLSLATALLLTATPAFAQQSKSESKAEAKAQARSNAQSGGTASGSMKVISTESVNGDDGNQSVIEVRIDNGNISVKRNGKDVPQDRIRREDDGRIIILDENGEAIQNINLFGNTAMRGFTFRGGNGAANIDGQGNSFWVGDESGEAPKVMLGVHMTEPGAALEKHLRLTPGKSAMITGVFEGLPAEVAGLGEFDIIVNIDGSEVADAGTIRKVLSAKKPGDTCTVHVIQSGEGKDLKIKLLAFDAEKLGSAKLIGKEPDAMAFNALDPLGGGALGAINLEGFENLGQLKDRVFVAPDFGKMQDQWATIQPRIAELQPQIQKSIEDAMRKYQGAIKMQQGDAGEGEAGNADVEAQLDRLDKRLAQLEELLGKLIDKQQPKQ